jgi:hypothetical protein
MQEILPVFMFLGLAPFFMLPAILAWTSKRPDRGIVVAVNGAYVVIALVLAAIGYIVGVVVALVAWLFLLAWALRPPKPATDRQE